MELNDKLLFFLSERATLNVWSKIVCPPEPATLSTTKKTYSSRIPYKYVQHNLFSYLI